MGVSLDPYSSLGSGDVSTVYTRGLAIHHPLRFIMYVRQVYATTRITP